MPNNGVVEGVELADKEAKVETKQSAEGDVMDTGGPEERAEEAAADRDKENKLIEPTKPLLKEPEEETTFRVIYNKNKYDVSFPLNLTVMELKTHLQSIIGKLY